MLNKHRLQFAIGMIVSLVLFAGVSFAENIDPDDDGSQYAYGENVGWLNFEPDVGGGDTSYGVQVSSSDLTGYVWAENIGWINLSPASYGGVVNDGSGNLSGYAWGENVGWINFDPATAGVTIDGSGNFSGYAWGENIGWIHLASASPVAYKVKTGWTTTCTVDLDDLQSFTADWLDTGSGWDLDGDGDDVDFEDFAIFSSYWLDACPGGWPM